MPNFLSLRELLTGAYIGNLAFVLLSVHTMYNMLLVSLPPCNLTHRWINMIDGSVFFIAFLFCSRLYWTRPQFCSMLLCCGNQSKFIEWMCIFTSHTGLSWLVFICSLVRYIFGSSHMSFDSDWISTLRRQWRREMVDDGVVLSPEFYIWEMQLPTCSSVVWLISMRLLLGLDWHPNRGIQLKSN